MDLLRRKSELAWPESTTDVRENQVMERIYDIIRIEEALHVQIVAHEPYQSVDELVAKITAISSVKRQRPRVLAVNKPEVKGASDGPKKGACFNCGGTDHYAARCPKPKKREKEKIECPYCAVEGHPVDRCWKKKKDDELAATRCDFCENFGHPTYMCGEMLGMMRELKVKGKPL